jgi:hypothetical protein
MPFAPYTASSTWGVAVTQMMTMSLAAAISAGDFSSLRTALHQIVHRFTVAVRHGDESKALFHHVLADAVAHEASANQTHCLDGHHNLLSRKALSVSASMMKSWSSGWRPKPRRS